MERAGNPEREMFRISLFFEKGREQEQKHKDKVRREEERIQYRDIRFRCRAEI